MDIKLYYDNIIMKKRKSMDDNEILNIDNLTVNLKYKIHFLKKISMKITQNKNNKILKANIMTSQKSLFKRSSMV